MAGAMDKAELLRIFQNEACGRLARARACLEQGAEGCDYGQVHQEFDSLHGGARAVDLAWLEHDARVVAGYARFLRNLGSGHVTAAAHELLLEAVRMLEGQCRHESFVQRAGPLSGSRLDNLLESLESALRLPPAETTPFAILVVDDSATSRLLFRAHMPPDTGHAIFDAADLDTALRLAAEAQPRLVFMDYNMPGENGVTIARRLRAAGCDAAFVLLTANVQQAVLEEAQAAGFAGVLEKPVSRDKIAAALRSLQG